MSATQDVIEYDVRSIVDRVDMASWERLAGKKVLLSGACGFLGRWFQHTVAELNRRLDPPVHLTGYDSMVAAELYAEPDPHIVLYRDDTAGTSVQADYIIHAAGIASPPRYLAHPLETIEAAVGQTRLLLEKARWQHSRMLFFSSSEIYGNPDAANLPTREDYHGNVSVEGPRACYDESKRMGETLCDVYFRHFQTDVVRVRPFNVYGPGMALDDRRAIPNLMAAAASGRPYQVYGDGQGTRTFCYVQDAMVGFWQVLLGGQSGQAYNIGSSGPEVKIADLITLFNRQISPLVYEMIATPVFDQGSPTRRCPDVSKAVRELGYSTEVSLEEGMRRTFAAMRSQ